MISPVLRAIYYVVLREPGYERASDSEAGHMITIAIIAITKKQRIMRVVARHREVLNELVRMLVAQ